MARLFADENFPLPVVEELRRVLAYTVIFHVAWNTVLVLLGTLLPDGSLPLPIPFAAGLACGGALSLWVLIRWIARRPACC